MTAVSVVESTTYRPSSARCREAARSVLKALRVFRSKTWSKSSSVQSANGFFSTAPGVCTTMSSRPCRSTTPANSSLTSTDMRASERTASTVPPCLPSAARVSWAAVSLPA